MSTGINIGKSIKILDEGSQITPDVSQIDFTGTGITATAVGNNVTVNVTGASGVWGISNASGVYTYYTTLTLAMAAATAGQTIELFADVTESSSTPVTLKAGVIIQGNGHTYKHTSTTGYTFITPSTGTYQFNNIKISRAVTTPTGVAIFAGAAGQFYHNYTMVFQSATVEYLFTTSVGATPFFDTVSVHVYYIDGLRAISNGSGVMIPTAGRVLNIKNSYIENTGTGSGFSAENFAPLGAVIENCYVTTVSGTGISLSYPDGVIRNCTVITTSGVALSGQSGATVYDSFGFSNTSLAFASLTCYNCTARTITGSAFATCNVYNSSGSSSTGYPLNIGFGGSRAYNSSFHTTSSIAVYSLDYAALLYNCSIITDYNNAAGHGVSCGGGFNPVFANNYIQVANASANCIRSSSGAFSCPIANNSFRGATTPINANVTQSIINTQDNQGNILL